MSQLSAFTTFMASTGPAFLTGPEKVINEVQLNTYILSRLLKGRGMAELVQGGTDIRDTIFLDGKSTYRRYKPGAPLAWSNPQTGSEISIPWRFSVMHMGWTDQEILLQMGASPTRAHVRGVYKKVRFQKEQNMWTTALNDMEAELWADPNGAAMAEEMEGASGETPLSIPVFVNEYTNGLPTGWSTVMGQNPVTKTAWQPVQNTYDADDPADTDGDQDGLFDALEETWMDVNFQPPATRQQYFESPKMGRQFIACSKTGMVLYKQLLRDANDSLQNWSDPGAAHPQFHGVDVVFVSTLNTAALYDDGASGFTDELSATRDGPRFYFLNGNYLKCIWHAKRYFHKHKVKEPDDQIDSYILPVSQWNNLFCQSRRRQAIVSPAA